MPEQAQKGNDAGNNEFNTEFKIPSDHARDETSASYDPQFAMGFVKGGSYYSSLINLDKVWSERYHQLEKNVS